MTPGAPPPSARRSTFWVVFALALAVGLWLRFDQITGQVIADDEWHCIQTFALLDYRFIFSHFGGSDYCIPLTLLAEWVANTWGVSEMTLRAPALAAGVAALVLLPLAVRRRFGDATALTFAGLLAISPLHVYFSRFARPYSIVFLLGVGGTLAFERWAAKRTRGAAVAYAACAILLPWFHAAIGPFAVAPIAWFLVAGRGERGEPFLARLRAVFPIAACVALGVAALLAAPVISDFATIRERAGSEPLELGVLGASYTLASGAPERLTSFLFGLGALAGLAAWLQRERRMLGYFAFLIACQLAALAVSRPFAISTPIVAVRYALPAVGLLLILAASGLVALDGALRHAWRSWPRHALPAFACFGLLAWGPIAPLFDRTNAVHYRPNDWMHHGRFQYEHSLAAREDSARRMLPLGVPPFYRKLGAVDRGPDVDRPILEAPWRVPWSESPFHFYQKVHRRRTIAGFVQGPAGAAEMGVVPWPDPRFRMRNLVDVLDFEGILERGVRYAVLHKDLRVESGRLDTPPIEVGPTIAAYEKRFGPPLYEDGLMVVFDLRGREPGLASVSR